MSFSIHLPEEEQADVFSIICESFKDCLFFEELVSAKLRDYLKQLTEITWESTKKVADRIFCAEKFKGSKEDRKLFSYIDLIFKTTNVLILLYLNFFPTLQFNSWEEMLVEYPSFSDVSDSSEKKFLLNFRNTMKVALVIIPASAHKKILIDIAGRLEGSKCREFITGGGQKLCVRRRVKIYEHESGTKPRSKKRQAPGDGVAPKRLKKYSYERFKYVSPESVKSLSNIHVESILRTTGQPEILPPQLETFMFTPNNKNDNVDQQGNSNFDAQIVLDDDLSFGDISSFVDDL